MIVPLPLQTNGKLRIPKILWYQTDDRITLRIILSDVKNYYLSVNLDNLKFSTTYDTPYYLCLYFFGAVIPEKTLNENLGREIKIQIPKAHRFAKWPRLQYHVSNYSQVIIDPERIAETTYWKPRSIPYTPWRNIDEYKRMNNIRDIQYDALSDHDDSDDERYNKLCDEY